MGQPESVRYAGREALVLPTVRDYARDLSGQIKDTLAKYGAESQTLDQSFPHRLLQVAATASLSSTDLKEKMSNLEEQRTELQKIGLMDATATMPFDIASLDELASEQSLVMSLYVEDTQKKLAVLTGLSHCIKILLNAVNSKFKHNSIRIERDKGFVVVGHEGDPLDPSSLSSGEQHELVLLYDLLFRVRPGTLVLIDEPELSLHVGWQKKFLPELLEIAKTMKFDAIIATHSPFIAGERSDLMVALATDIDV